MKTTSLKDMRLFSIVWWPGEYIVPLNLITDDSDGNPQVVWTLEEAERRCLELALDPGITHAIVLSEHQDIEAHPDWKYLAVVAEFTVHGMTTAVTR